MKTKVLEVTMPDGSVWQVSAAIIAENRATHFSKKEPEASRVKVFNDEFLYTLGSDDELMDWAPNNMNWSDVKDHARMVKVPTSVDYEEGWCNGDKCVKEIETNEQQTIGYNGSGAGVVGADSAGAGQKP